MPLASRARKLALQIIQVMRAVGCPLFGGMHFDGPAQHSPTKRCRQNVKKRKLVAHWGLTDLLIFKSRDADATHMVLIASCHRSLAARPLTR